MQIEYGPPGVSGVQSLQYLSGDVPDEPSGANRFLRLVAVAGGVAWGLSFASKQPRRVRRNLALGSMGAALLSLVIK